MWTIIYEIQPHLENEENCFGFNGSLRNSQSRSKSREREKRIIATDFLGGCQQLR